MHIISHKAFREFYSKYPDAKNPLDSWYKTVKAVRWQHFDDVRKTYPSADLVSPYIVFNVHGGHCRIIALINFKTHRVFIRYVLTHKEYDKGKWKP